jgi:hypothetical protein
VRLTVQKETRGTGMDFTTERFQACNPPARSPRRRQGQSLRHWLNRPVGPFSISDSQSDRPAGSASVQPHLQFHKRQCRASNLGGQVTDEMTEMTGVTGIASLPKYRGWPVSAKLFHSEKRTPRNPEGPHSERVTKNREKQGAGKVGPKGVWSGMPALPLALRFFTHTPLQSCDRRGTSRSFSYSEGQPGSRLIRNALSVEQTALLVTLSLRHQTRVHSQGCVCHEAR